MSTVTWSALSAGNWGTGANWSGGSKPATGDDVVLDGTSVVNCTVDETPANLNTFTITIAYTGIFNAAAFAFTIASTINISSAGQVTISGVWTQTGDADCTVTTTGSNSTVLGTLDLKGSGTLITKASGTGWGELKCCYTTKTTTYTVTGTGYFKKLTPISDGVLTISAGATFAVQSSSDYTFDQGVGVVNGTGNLTLSNSSGTLTVSKAIHTGAGTLSVRTVSITTSTNIIIEGILTTSGAMTIYNAASTGDQAITINNSTITSATSLKFGTSSATANAVVINCGNTTFNCASFDSTTYNAKAWNLNLQTSQWTVKGTWTFGSNTTVNSGTSHIIANTNDVTFTSNGKSLYDITLNEATKTFTFADALSCHTLTLTAGNYTNTGTTITCSGDALFDGTGTLNFGNGITLTGASSTLHIGSTVGTVTATSCVLTFNTSTAGVLDDDKSVGFGPLIFGADAVWTNSGAVSTTFTGATPLTITNGGTFTINRSMNFWTTGNNAVFSITGNPTITAIANTIAFGPNATGLTVTIPAITLAAALSFAIKPRTSSISATYNQSGNISLGGTLTIYQSNSGGTFTYNTNNYSLTSSSLKIGNANATGTSLTINFGSSTVNCNTLDTASNNDGASTINLQSSTWTVASTAYAIGSLSTIVPSTSTCTFTSNTLCTITSAGKSLPRLIVQTPLTINGGCTIARLTVTATKTITWQAGQTFVISAYTAGDWDSDVFVSSSTGSKYNLTVPAGVRTNALNIRDCDASSGQKIYVLTGTGAITDCTNVEFYKKRSAGGVFGHKGILIGVGTME